MFLGCEVFARGGQSVRDTDPLVVDHCSSFVTTDPSTGWRTT
jgi:hypothetical protein